MTQIQIWDAGCGVRAELRGRNITVVDSGGTPAAEILRSAGISERMKNSTIERLIRARWERGYDGDPSMISITIISRCGSGARTRELVL